MSVENFLKSAKKIEEEAEQRREEKKHNPAAHDESNWIVSYADMMTLLCGFFIMMFSMAKLDAPEFEKVRESVSKQFGGEFQQPTKDMARFLTQIMDENGVKSDVVIKSDPFGVSVVFQSAVFFDTLSASVRPQARVLVNKIIDGVAERQAKEEKFYKVVVEGHTDSKPVVGGIYPSNWELSSARAASVIRMFLDRGFRPDLLAAVGYADTRPELPSRNPAGEWDEQALAKNRRVVIRILQPKVDAIPLPTVPEARPEQAAVSAP